MQPKLRFNGFTSPWQKHSLSDKDFVIVAGGDIDYSNIKEKGKYPVIANALSNSGIVGFYDDDYRVAAPAVTITGRGDIGIAVARRENFTPVVRLLALQSTYNIDVIANAINNHPKYLESTGVPQLTVPKLKSYCIALPDLLEQESIGHFIQKLDQLISSSEAEIARLKQLKKGALQALFPQPGENIPKIRFNGFSKPWKQVLVEELGEWAKGQTLSKDMISNIGKHKCLHYGKLFSEDEIIHQIETYTDINPIVTSQGNEILIPDSDVTPTGLGRCTHIPFKGVILGSGINIMRVKDNYDPHFCALNLTFNKEKIIKEVKGTTVMHVHAYNLSKIKLLIPSSLEEQAKIGEFFKQLDDQISLQEKKLLKLKQLKQAALNQMFV